MGLTVHYELHAHVEDDQACRMVQQLRRDAKALKFAGVERVKEFESPRAKQRTLRTDPDWWLKVRMRHVLAAAGSRSGYVDLNPSYAIGFMCWPGDTEPSCFGLCRFNRSRQMPQWAHDAADRLRLFEGYHWQSFCKTQYASSPTRGGVEGFVAAHTRLISLLDRAKALGIDVNVVDEGGFWTHRDPTRLAAEVQRWNRLVAGVVGGLGDALDIKGQAPIREYPNYEHLEAEGESEIRRLIRRPEQ